MASLDKQQQMQLELNVLKERERSRKAVEKYSKKNAGGIEKENYAEYDWSSAVNRQTSKKFKRHADAIEKQKESRDDSVFVGTARKIKPQRPLSLSLSDSEIGFKTKSDGAALETMVSDVRDVLISLNDKKPWFRRPSMRDVGIRASENSTPSARDKFDKLNKMYQRVTGDKSIRTALNDDGTDDSDTHSI